MDIQQLHEKFLLPYLAGYFDGEGCIHISYTGYSHSYKVLCTIGCGDRAVLSILHREFGGKLYAYKEGAIGRIYQWRLLSSNIIPFLRAILPYLILKKEQAEIAIRFQEMLTERYRSKHTRSLSSDEKEVRNTLMQECSNLKKKEVN